MKNTVLVVGGAGYIGSHAALELKDAGFKPVIFDSFINSDPQVTASLGVPTFKGSLENANELEEVFSQVNPIAVMHFAAFAYVGESVTEPAKYYQNNLSGTLKLLDVMRKKGCDKLIFSSTCATYGVPVVVPINENCPQNPINPYGHSKLMVEQVLRDYSAAYKLRSVVFRYFNAAGADAEGRIGEVHQPETHAVPLVIRAAMGKGRFKVFGTCIRDYIHVTDIASAHILGLQALVAGADSDVFNIGNGQGYSVLDLINAVSAVSGGAVAYDIEGRRPGDPPVLVAAAEKLKAKLGWRPKHPSLRDIVETAWRWHKGPGASFLNW